MMKRVLLPLALLFGSTAHAQQMPGPFDHPGTPASQPACSKEYIAGVQEQLEAIKSLRGKTGEQIQAVCTAIDDADIIARTIAKGLGKDPDSIIDEFDTLAKDIGKTFGVPNLNLRQIKHICEQSVGEVERGLTNEAGRLASEISRCKGNEV